MIVILAVAGLGLGCSYDEKTPYAVPSDGGNPGGGGGGGGATDSDADGDADSGADSDSDTDTEPEVECEVEGGYCAEYCDAYHYASEAYGGCDTLEFCCLPYGSDDNCLEEPEDCLDIGPDDDSQAYGCCWANTAYWCDSSMEGVVQYLECAEGYVCSFSYEVGGVWCL